MIKISDEVWATAEIRKLGKIDDSERIIGTIRYPCLEIGRTTVLLPCPHCGWLWNCYAVKLASYPQTANPPRDSSSIGYKIIHDRETHEFREGDPVHFLPPPEFSESIQTIWLRVRHKQVTYAIYHHAAPTVIPRKAFNFLQSARYEEHHELACPKCSTDEERHAIKFRLDKPRGSAPADLPDHLGWPVFEYDHGLESAGWC